MIHFLLVYDRQQGILLHEQRFLDQEPAMRERFALERTYARRPDVEVVVLTAVSEETLHSTHARYFTTFGDLVRKMKVPSFAS